METFRELNPKHLDYSAFRLIADKWGLLSAKVGDDYNMMTINWGTFGHLWSKNIVNVFVRPQRYTYEFMENSDTFTLCFFEDKYHEALKIAGSKSGREIDKKTACGLTPIIEGDAVYYQEAHFVFICKKIYKQELSADGFVDQSIAKDIYPEGDFHTSYIGEITKVLVRQEQEKVDHMIL